MSAALDKWRDKMNLVVFAPLKDEKPWTLAGYQKSGGYDSWKKILADKITREADRRRASCPFVICVPPVAVGPQNSSRAP